MSILSACGPSNEATKPAEFVPRPAEKLPLSGAGKGSGGTESDQKKPVQNTY
jgi:hypothetical protein